jgi:hypothetical protein
MSRAISDRTGERFGFDLDIEQEIFCILIARLHFTKNNGNP